MTDLQDRDTELVDEAPRQPDAAPEELGIFWGRFGTLLAILGALLVLGGVKMLLVALSIGLFLVFHEAGHYLTAKWSGMKVTEFFVGFGHRIFAFKRGETTFGLKVWIPFGAYVRIVGMNNLEDVDPADEARTYRQAAWYKRVLTIVAGPATHFVTAFALLAFVGWQYGPSLVDDDAWVVDDVAPAGVLGAAGIESGDRILGIGDMPTETEARFEAALAATEGDTVEVTYQRLERSILVNRQVELAIPGGAADDPSATLGFTAGAPDWEVHRWAVGDVTPFSAAEAAGLQTGDEILSISGTPTPYFSDLAALVPDVRGEQVTLEVRRDGEILELETRIWERLTAEGARGINGLYVGDMVVSIDGTPVANYDEFVAEAQQYLGRSVEVEVVYDSRVHTETVEINDIVTDNAVSGFLGVSRGAARADALSLGAAARQAPGQIVELMQAIFDGARQMVTTTNGWRGMFALGPAEANTIGDDPTAGLTDTDFRPRSSVDENRPISIIGVVGIANQLETDQILSFLAVMNLFFGLFNLVPLLPLDGGHIALATYERIRSIGRASSYHADAAKLLPVTYVVVGFFLLVGMIAIVRDIVDPIQL